MPNSRTNSHPRKGKTASRKLTINNEKLNLHVGFHRKHAVPEGGELCLTACVVTEGNGTCGKPKPPRPSPKGANSRQRFALFEDDVISYIYTASSASLHMRLSIVGRLRRPAALCCHPKGLRMNHFILHNIRH